MVSASELMRAGTSIETALKSWLAGIGVSDAIAEAWESSPGHIRAVLASDYFKGIGLSERQNLVWEWLEKTVDKGQLRLCFGVHVMDLDEYHRFGGSPN